MTDQEKKLQRAQLLIELEDAQSELAHLQDKAKTMAHNLELIGKKLINNATLSPSKGDFSSVTDLDNRLRPDQQGHLDFVAVTKVIEELRAARQNVFNLQERKTALANPGWTIAS